MKKLLSGLLAGAAAFTFSLAPADAQTKPPEKVTLMLNWYLYSEHAPVFLGKENGYYAKQGIDLDIQEGRGSAVTAQAVAAKSVPFGYIDVTTMIKAAAKEFADTESMIAAGEKLFGPYRWSRYDILVLPW